MTNSSVRETGYLTTISTIGELPPSAGVGAMGDVRVGHGVGIVML